MKDLSIIIPLHNEEENIIPLLKRIHQVLSSLSLNTEIILVDDGSQDNTLMVCKKQQAYYTNIKIIKLSRRWGLDAALEAGIQNAHAKAIIMMDGDLQHPPEYIPLMIEEWKKGAQVVNMIRKQDLSKSWWQEISSYLFYPIFNLLASLSLPSGSCDFRLISQKVAQALTHYEGPKFIRGLIHYLGFKQTSLYFKAPPRKKGKRKFTPIKRILLAWKGILIFGYSKVALLFFSLYLFFTFLCLALAFLYPPALLLAFIGWLLASTLCLGILISGLSTILQHVQKRPTYIIDKIIVSSTQQNLPSAYKLKSDNEDTTFS